MCCDDVFVARCREGNLKISIFALNGNKTVGSKIFLLAFTVTVTLIHVLITIRE